MSEMPLKRGENPDASALRRKVSRVREQATEVDRHLLVDVFVLRFRQHDPLVAEVHDELAVVFLAHVSDFVEKGDHVVPLEVVAGRMLLDVFQSGAVMLSEVLGSRTF